MSILLRQPTREECQLVRVWRNQPDVLPMLRTGSKTEAEQDAFYEQHIVGWRTSPHRYYGLEHDGRFIGLGGLTYLSGAYAEISLILGPMFRKQGLGTGCVETLVAHAFDVLDLRCVIGECYAQSPALHFWLKMLVNRWPVEATWVPRKHLRWEWRRA